MNMKKLMTLACVTLALFTAGTSSAANLTWDANGATALQTDGAGTWTTASQWWTGSANATWTSGDDAIFGNGGAGGTIALGGSVTATSLTFNRFSGAYTLGTSGDLTLNGGLTINPSAGAVTISRPVTLGGAQGWTNNAGTTLTVSGAVTNNGYLLTIGGTTPVSLAAPTAASGITISGAIGSGAGGLTKNGISVLTLTGNNGYSGTTTVNGGYLLLSGSGAINSTGAIALNGGNLYLLNTAQANRVADGAAISSTGGTITYNNTSGANTYTETLGAVTLSSGQLDVVEAVNQASTGSQTLTLGGLSPSGTSAVTFSSAGTRTTKNMIVVSGAGATPANQIIGPWATIGTAANAQTDYAVYNGSAQVVDAAIAGTGQASWTAGAQAFTQSSTPETLGGTRTMTALRNTAATATTALNGNFLETYGLLNGVGTLWTISGTGAVRTPTGGGNLFLTSGSGAITVSASITDNSGTVNVVKSGTAGTLTLSGTNTYSGTTILNAGTLAANTTNALPGYGTSGKVVFTGGTLQLPSAWAMADINTLVANATKTAGALAIDTANGSQTQTAAWNLGALGLTKVGANTLVLNQANTYSGRTTVSAGTLQLSHANALGSSELNLAGNATISLGTTVNLTTLTLDYQGGTISGGTLAFGAGGSIQGRVRQQSTATTISSAITGSPTVILDANANANPPWTFAPTSGSQTLGKVTLSYNDGSGGDKASIYLAGTTTGNTVSEITDIGGYSTVTQTSGSWTYGNITLGQPSGYIVTLSGGDMFLNGTVKTLTVSGGTLHYDNLSAVNTSLTMNGGNLDNSCGAAITTLTYNPTMAWGGDFTFIGSQGANSDLNLGTGAVTLSNNSLTGNPEVTVQNAATTLTVGGIIGGVGLTKAGPGTLKITGANTYSGPTVVSAGTLSISNNLAIQNSALDTTTGSGVITFNTGITTPTIGGLNGSVDLATKFSTGYSSVTTLTLNPQAGVIASYSGAIANGSMNLTKSGAGTQILSGNNTYGGTTTISAGTLVAGTANSLPNYGTSGKVVLSGTGTLQVPVDGVAWTIAQFETLRANATVAANTLLGLDIGSGTQTQTGAYGGVNGFAKIGTGTLELNQANTYSGATTVSGGTLLLNGASGAIASSSGITVGSTSGTTGTLTMDNSAANNSDRVGSVGLTLNNATFNYIGNASSTSTETIGTITAAAGHNQIVLSGLATLTSTAGAVTRTAGATLNILADGVNQQFAFTGGSAGINKGVFYGATAATANEFAYYPGAGAAVVAPTYDGSGNFATPAATLTASKHNKLSATDAGEGAVSIYSLNMPNNYSLTTLTGNLTFSNGADQGAIIKSGGGAAQIGTAGNAFDIVGQASGELIINTVDTADNLTLNVGVTATSTALTKTGAGTLTLTANRDYLYTGATYVNAGTLVLNSLTSAAAGGFRSSVTINNGGTAKLGASNKIIDTAVFTVNAGGTFDLAGFSDTIASLNGSGSVANTGGAATLTLKGANSTFSGVISGNTALTILNGTLTLSGQNTYSGVTQISASNNSGNLKLGASNALPSGGAINVGAGGSAFCSLDLAGYDQTAGAIYMCTGYDANNYQSIIYNSVGSSKLTLTGGGSAVNADNASGSRQGVGYIYVTTLDLNNAAQTFTVADSVNYANDLIVTSVIQNGALTKTGAGTMLLSGASTYSGATTISGGTLEIGGSGVLGSGAYAANITNNATFSYNSTASQTLSGVISGTGALVKNNTGTLSLTGPNTYSGATTVSAGTLLVNGSLNVTSRVTVASAGTLAGAGTMGIVTNNGTLAVGNGATMGTLTTSNLVMGAGSSYVFDLNGTGSGDSVTVNGNLTLNSSSVITVVPQGVFNGGYTYTLFNYKTVSGTLPTTVLGGNPIRAMTLMDDSANKRIILKVEGPAGSMIFFW